MPSFFIVVTPPMPTASGWTHPLKAFALLRGEQPMDCVARPGTLHLHLNHHPGLLLGDPAYRRLVEPLCAMLMAI